MRLHHLRALVMMDNEAGLKQGCHASTLWIPSIPHPRLRYLWSSRARQQSRVYGMRRAVLQTSIPV